MIGKANTNKIEDYLWRNWKRTVNTHCTNKVRREKINREDKIMVVTFLNSQFEKAIVQFLRGDNQDG